MKDKLTILYSIMLITLAVTDYILESYNVISMLIIIASAVIIFIDRIIIIQLKDANCVTSDGGSK